MGTQRFHLTAAVYALFRAKENILLLKRKNTGYEDGNYGLVAGHLDGGETPIDALIREVQEEAGVTIIKDDITFVHVMHRMCDDGERVGLFFEIYNWKGDIQNNEPDKCEELRWFPITELPTNTIAHVRSAIDEYQKGNFYSERIG